MKKRLYISLNDYGKTFKFTETPIYAVDNWSSDMISIVTPINENAWYNWTELSGDKLDFWKSKWNETQKKMGYYKYEQIMKCKEKL